MSAILRTVRMQAAARTRSMASNPADIKVMQKQMCKDNYNLSHGKDLPTYMKGGADRSINYAMVGLFSASLCLSMRGFYNMSFGINKS